MKDLHFESTTTLSFDKPVVNHHFLLRYLPPSFAGQRIVSAVLTLRPAAPYTLSCDGFGNLNQTGCIPYPHREFVYSVSGRAILNEKERQSEWLLPLYKYPSAYTKPEPELVHFASGLTLRGSTLDRAVQLADAVYRYMTYAPGTTTTATTAAEAFRLGGGVCQDYAHIFITLARLSGIPARYANGLPVGEGQTHAWAEVYADGKWVGVDPTHNRLAGESYIRFCVGRDFGDCALERGILFGDANQSQTSFTQVSEQ